MPSWHPTPGEDPNWYLTPCFLIILNNRLQIKLLNTFAQISIRFTPLHLLGSDRSPFLGAGTTWPSCHSSKYTLSSHNSVMRSKWWRKFSSDIELKAFGGTPLRPGDLSLVNSWMALMNSVYKGGRQSHPWPPVSVYRLSQFCLSVWDCWVLFEVVCKYANIFFIVLCKVPWGESHLYYFCSSVMTCLTSLQTSDAHPSRSGIKVRVVDFFSKVTRPPCFGYIHCFVDLVLECFQVAKCSCGRGIIIGSDFMEHLVLGFKGGC